MDRKDWRGVFAAITTPLRTDLTVDHDALAEHVSWLIESGCRGIVPNGSLGESATLAFSEKVEVLRTCCRGAGGVHHQTTAMQVSASVSISSSRSACSGSRGRCTGWIS